MLKKCKKVGSIIILVFFMSQLIGLESFNASALDLTIDSSKQDTGGALTKVTTGAAVEITTGAAITIVEARTLDVGEEATVSGVVSFNDRSKTLHIQDSTGGIAIYDSKGSFKTIKAGDEVQVTGTKKVSNGLVQLIPSNIEVTGYKGIPEPKLLTIDELNKGDYASQYVRIENAIIAADSKGINGTLTQGANKLVVYYISNIDKNLLGSTVNVEGTMGIYNGINQIYGSSCTVTKAEDVTKDFVIEHTPTEKASIQTDLLINAKITENTAESVKLSYRTIGSTDFTTVDMIAGTDNNYSCTILKDKLSLAGIEYYITVKNSKIETKSKTYNVAITNEDIEGPVISNLIPAENSIIKVEAIPQISALIQDATGINLSLIKIYFDGIEVTSASNITSLSPLNAEIKYTPAGELKDGIHKVKIVVSDIAGNNTTKEWSFRKGEFKLKHLFGQLHSHTNISDGTGSLNDAYQWAKDNGADYFAVTDHSNWFDNDTKANIADGSISTEWVQAHKTADEFNKPGEFTAIYGYEMTWSGSTGGWGHINTFNTPGFETRSNSKMDLQNYYKTLQTQPEGVSQLNHPGTTFGDFADFGYYNKETDKYVNLVEVGNGEGPIRGTGYFPSYDYYTRALDKGWHVAPTNNQDNHKGKWFTANTGRTIILAEDNTRDSIYDAIRNKRVYASEDTDMTINFTANGEVMGSFLPSTDKLDLAINANDPETNDTIKKISIIANGGVEVTSKKFDTASVDWNFTLDPEYSYYYVKVVEADGDIAVTAPVWVGDSLSVGVQDMKASSEVTMQGENVPISLGVYNNGSADTGNVNVEFYLNEISEANKICATSIEKVKSGGTEKASFNWKAQNPGDYKIFAKVTIDINGKEKVLTTSTKVLVANPSEANKVVIDGAHYNQYISGNYAGKYLALQGLLQKNNNSVVVLNKDIITDETLKGVKLLILTTPQSTEKTSSGLHASKFESSEIEAIKKYVNNGGNLIVSTLADYGDGTGDYSKGKQLNPILEAIGSELRVNDDEVIDNTTNGGQNYRLSLNKYSSQLYNLTNGVKDNDDLYSFYSGASIILADGATGENVDFLVKAHETTTTLDSDKQKDNIPVETGKVSVLAAEKLKSGGKVVVSGSIFFSDFEIDSTNGDKYTNKKIVQNIANWMLPEKDIETVKIADLKADNNNDGILDLKGKKYTIEGYVTSQSEAVTPKNAFFEVVYVQDETGGTCVFGISNTKLEVGQKVRITGKVDEYQGEFELQISDEDNDLKVLDGDTNVITPQNISTHDSMLKVNGGKLVQVQGNVVKMDSSNLYLDDGTGVSRVYVEGYIWDGINSDMKGKWDSTIKIGSTVSAIGIASMDPEGGRLRVRNTSEIKVVTDNSNNNNGSNNNNNSGNNNNSNTNKERSKHHNNSNHDSLSNTISNNSIKGKSIEKVANMLKTKINGKIKKIETISTKSGGSAQVVTIVKGDLTDAKVISAGVNDELTVKAGPNDKVYMYMEALGTYMEVESRKLGGTTTFSSDSSSVYVITNDIAGEVMVKEGWNMISGSWYFIENKGKIKTGWYNDKGIWYYMKNDGKMKTGWFKDIDEKWYFLKASGEMAFDTIIDGYVLGSTGEWIKDY